MTKIRALTLLPLACLAMAGCKFGLPGTAKAPTGQVVATVNGQEITVRDLQAEMGDASFPDAKSRKAAEETALNQILTRDILADAARKQGLDKTPDFALQKDRVVNGLLAQTLQNKIVASVPPPTREQAEAFMADHPDIFSQRKIWSVDQIRFAAPSDPAVLKALQPLNTMQQVQDLLTADHIQFQRQAGALDAVGADPRLVDAIVKLPPNEVFIIPTNGAVTVNQITGVRVQPLGGEQAVNYALLLLRRQHAQQAVQQEFTTIAQAAKPHVQINKAYQAAPPAKGAAAPAPANGRA